VVKRFDDKVHSISRALIILETLAKETEGIGIIELSDRTDINKTTVYRVLSTLMEREYVEQDSQTGKYLLGVRILGLANALFKGTDIRAMSRPFLNQLSEQIDGQIFLTKLNYNEVIIIDKIEGEEEIINIKIGDRIPLHCTAIGKVFLSNKQYSEFNKILSSDNVVQYTEKTIVELERLRQCIKLVAIQGYALEDEEFIEGIGSIAVPLYNYSRNIVSVIGIYDYMHRLKGDSKSRVILKAIEGFVN
jgi:IclR family KDG regulon transcriptional repressor